MASPNDKAWMNEAVELRSQKPRHILFMCVANSARSQIAEGLARAAAPKGVRISSAGSEPKTVNPLAIDVLSEIGIDISAHRSKAVDEIDSRSVDAVITLCAEEVCPVFFGPAKRLHWGMPDPALADGSKEQQLVAFRKVRDELQHRLTVLFSGWI